MSRVVGSLHGVLSFDAPVTSGFGGGVLGNLASSSGNSLALHGICKQKVILAARCDICIDMCMDMCMDMCIDMCIDRSTRTTVLVVLINMRTSSLVWTITAYVKAGLAQRPVLRHFGYHD